LVGLGVGLGLTLMVFLVCALARDRARFCCAPFRQAHFAAFGARFGSAVSAGPCGSGSFDLAGGVWGGCADPDAGASDAAASSGAFGAGHQPSASVSVVGVLLA
jgi:hypothetical protein